MGALMVDAERCIGCKRCVRACAFGGIEVVDRCARVTDACTLCGGCVEACPVGALTVERDAADAGDRARELASYRDIWVVAQVDATGEVLPVAFELLAKARELAGARGCRVVAVLGEAGRVPGQAERLAPFADEVLHAVDGRFAMPDAEVFARWICDLAAARRPETVLFGATAFGRALAPRIAVQLQTGLTADCTALAIDAATGLLQQTRPAFGGNLMATIECPLHRPQMATVRPGVFASPLVDDASEEAATLSQRSASRITEVGLAADVAPRARVLAVEPVASGSIAQAERLVVVGRGIGSKKHLPLMRRLAELLHAELGCTRPLVEAGWLDYACQVGQTGAAVAPTVLISLGVSGAIQHLAGIGGAQTVIAVNEDPSAAIFGAANYAVVGDCIAVAEELVRQLEAS